MTAREALARDHRRLRVFNEARALTIDVYGCTRDFPRDEWFGLRAQMRRAAVSTGSNIVEGNARRGTREYLNFLNVARGSASELDYLLGLSGDLHFIPETIVKRLRARSAQLIPQLEALIQTMELILLAEERKNRTKD